MTLPSIEILLIGAGVVLALAALVAFLLFRDPAATARRVEAAFRRPRKPPRTAGDEQYYRPYWSR
jgi:hypothetical protein